MTVRLLELTQFRCFDHLVLEPDPTGLTVLQGRNGSGKTSVLEAIAWIATMRSMRGSPRDAMVRSGADNSFVRAEVDSGGRKMLVEGEIVAGRRSRVQVNRQAVRRRSDLGEALRVTVFSPDDLQLVQGGPQARRDFVDEVLIGGHPRNEELVSDMDRILRQRGALLRQAGGRLSQEVADSLDVWDLRLAEVGTALATRREELLARIAPLVCDAYEELSGESPRREVGTVGLSYRRTWDGELADALAGGRSEDLRKQATGLGPHRDEIEISIASRPARTHASQGEQRSVALALRLAAHELLVRSGSSPVLLLDDVFSELDAARSSALVRLLPPGQVLLTTALGPPPQVSVDRVVDVGAGGISKRPGAA